MSSNYTLQRLEKDKNANLNMLTSGFVDGKLIYILEFPFNTPTFYQNLKNKLTKWENKLKGSVSMKGQFLRSADFTYKDYIESEDLKVVYLLKKTELENYKSFISKNFFEFLWNKSK